MERIIVDPRYKLEGLPRKQQVEKAMRFMMTDFCSEEMSMQQHIIDQLEPVDIFFPQDGRSKTMYIKFKTISSVMKVVQHIKNLRSSSSIEDYYTPMVYPRYAALEEHCHNLRVDPVNPMATNIRLGEEDFLLRVRLHRNHPNYNPSEVEEWRFIAPIDLPPLPPFDHNRSGKINQAVGRTLAPTPDPIEEEDDDEDDLIEVDQEDAATQGTVTTTTTHAAVTEV